MRIAERKIKAHAALKYPEYHLVFTGENSAVAIPENGKAIRIRCQKKKKLSFVKLTNWLIPAFIWFMWLWFMAAFLMEFLV